MNILLLSTGGKIGGEETFTKNLALSLIRRGHNVTVCPGGEVQRHELQINAISICDIDISSRRPLGLLGASKQVCRFAKQNNIQIIHAQSVGPAIMGVLAKLFFHCQIPWIWHNHGISDFSYRFIVRFFNKLDLCIANSDYVSVMLINHGVHREKCKRIHNGIDAQSFYVTASQRQLNKQNITKEFDIPISDNLLTYVGRLSPEKGVKCLLEAFNKLWNLNKNVSCLIVGDGSQREELFRVAESMPCSSKIKFAGFRDDISRVLSASDALILPSLIETFSLTILQSFSIGTPVIASDVGGTPEQILNKFNGLLFKSQDVDDLAEKLMIMISNKQIALKCSTHGRQLVENYLNDTRMTNEILSVYQSLI